MSYVALQAFNRIVSRMYWGIDLIHQYTLDIFFNFLTFYTVNQGC